MTRNGSCFNLPTMISFGFLMAHMGIREMWRRDTTPAVVSGRSVMSVYHKNDRKSTNIP